jgi:membrane protease YdiL (CAAX protease family)
VVDGGGPFLDRPGAPPRTRADGLAWVLFALLGFVAGEVAGVAVVFGVAAALGQVNNLTAITKESVPPEWYIAATLVGLWIGFFGAAWLGSLARGTRHLVADLGIRFRPIDVLGVVIGVGGQGLVTLMYEPFIHNIHNFNGPTTKLTGSSHGGGFVLIALLTVVGAPFVEEVFFRGLLLKGLLRLCAPTRVGPSAARTAGIVGAIVLDGVIFGLLHGELVQLAGLATFGIVLAAISYRTGRLGMNMVSHASFNAVAIVSVLNSRGGVIH